MTVPLLVTVAVLKEQGDQHDEADKLLWLCRAAGVGVMGSCSVHWQQGLA